MRLAANPDLSGIEGGYLFSEISERVARFRAEHPEKRVLDLGIGDISLPLSPHVADAMARASLSLASEEHFFGYGNAQGEPPLRRAIAKRYSERGVSLGEDEIFISDGAKCELGNILELFGDIEVAICEPCYPVYRDASRMAGKRIRTVSTDPESGFLPSPESLTDEPRLIYLCSPNNPTGAVFSYELLKKWVDFALGSGSVIVFDVAYEAFITDGSLPHSIYEIDGANGCAIEVGSFSKMAGFTGVRCGWTVVPRHLTCENGRPLHDLRLRWQGSRYGGASRISQAGALASLSEIGRRECEKNIAHYMENARLIADFLEHLGIPFTGGKNAPYLWLKCPENMRSWELFDLLLNNFGIVGTPGSGFGGAWDERGVANKRPKNVEKNLENINNIPQNAGKNLENPSNSPKNAGKNLENTNNSPQNAGKNLESPNNNPKNAGEGFFRLSAFASRSDITAAAQLLTRN